MWMLSDFSPTNGATEVVPGSHLTGAHPNQEDQSTYPINQPEACISSGQMDIFKMMCQSIGISFKQTENHCNDSLFV